MANIKVTIEYPISDGTKLKFRTPCESTEVEGLVVKYPVENGVGSALKTFTFVDAHGTKLSGVGNVFTSDVMIEVLLDVTKGRAYIQNADTNSYIEDIKVTVKRMEEERQTIFAEAGKSVDECIKASNKANEAANTLNLSAEEIRSGGFVKALKEINNGDNFTLWVGTQSEYGDMKDNIPVNTFCIITDSNQLPKYVNLGIEPIPYDVLEFDYFIARHRGTDGDDNYATTYIFQSIYKSYDLKLVNAFFQDISADGTLKNYILTFELGEGGYTVDKKINKCNIITGETSVVEFKADEIIGVKLPELL